MGYLLKEALKTLCGVNQWSYAVFWKIGFQNPKLLIWEECYYEPLPCSSLPRICGIDNPELTFEEWESYWVSGEPRALLGIQAEDKVQALTSKMMMSNQINIVGEGLVGRAAFTGNHQWIQSEHYARDAYPPEVLHELGQQFSAGMQTVAVIPVLTHGVVQLGSSLAIMENMGFVNDVNTLILQLGCVPGALFSEIHAIEEPIPKIGAPICLRKSVSTGLSGNYKSTNSAPSIANTPHQQNISSHMSAHVGQTSHSLIKQLPGNKPNPPFRSKLENGVKGAEANPSNSELWKNQKASSYFPRSGSEQEPFVGSLSSNNCSFRSIEEQILSEARVQMHSKYSLDRSSGFKMAHSGTNAGSISTSQKDSVSNPFLDGSPLQNGVTNNLRSVSIPCSFSNARLQNAGSSNREVSTSDMADHLIINHLLSGGTNGGFYSMNDQSTQVESVQKNGKNDILQALGIPLAHLDEHTSLRPMSKNVEDVCVTPSGDDLFDILGVDFKNKLFNDTLNSYLNNEPDSNTKHSGKNNSTCMNHQDGGSYLYSGIFSGTGSDHLLDAVVSSVHSASKQSPDDNASCNTTLTKISSSSALNDSLSYGRVRVSDQIQSELFGLPKTLAKAVALGSSSSYRSGCSKEEEGNYSQTSSIYGSQISSWVDQGHNMKQNCSVSTGYSKKPDEVGKSNRKRLKPGENPRPRPKDRQMIQDRVKELREIVPNGAKCSIDALLERTIKHMLFLQSVTKHADKLKQTGESKIISKEGGLLLKDNFEGGATWAYEVGSQSMVCPIIVEDLNPPRQMLVEMLCEERGLFLEIADIIRGLGLTILKGVMETRNDKIWARFVVEANRDVTRMEIFLSLVRLLEQTIKSNAASVNGLGIDNENVMVHQTFHQVPSIPATGRPCNFQ